MGKKKARKVEQTEEKPPDPRLLVLKSIITNEKTSRVEEQNTVKKALLPLKRVNSSPLIYENIPIAKSLFPDSKSVEYGFEGVVDVPNQVFYKEEMSDDVFDTSDIPFPDDLSTSLSFMDSKELDQYEIDKLNEVKLQNDMHFLKTRVGKDNMVNLLENVKSPLLDLPKRKDSDTNEDNTNKIPIGFDAVTPTIAKAGRVRRIYVFIVFALIILIAGTLIGLVYAGIRIPILTGLLRPNLSITQDNTTSITTAGSLTPSFSNVTQDNATVSTSVGSLMPSISNLTQENTTYTPSTTHMPATTVTNATSIDISFNKSLGDGGLDISGWLPQEREEIMHVIHAEIYKINGSGVNSSWEYHWPPNNQKRSQMLKDMFTDVYEYLGFRLETVTIDDIIPKRQSSWRIQARIFAHAEQNLGIMKWYGFDGKKSMQHSSRYITRIAQYVETMFRIRHKSSIQYYWSHFGSTFMDKIRKYEDKIAVERPPAHIPTNWGYCYAMPVCYD